jgi:hypothetical protein
MGGRPLIAPIVLRTTQHTQTAAFRCQFKRENGDWPPVKWVRLLIDAYDILRVVEVQRDKDQSGDPLCEVSYTMENPVKDGEDTQLREVVQVKVRHSLDEIIEMMDDAKREKKEWE